LPLSGGAGNNPASCREKNTPIPELLERYGYFFLTYPFVFFTVFANPASSSGLTELPQGSGCSLHDRPIAPVNLTGILSRKKYPDPSIMQ
jgi:hypothetical protein